MHFQRSPAKTFCCVLGNCDRFEARFITKVGAKCKVKAVLLANNWYRGDNESAVRNAMRTKTKSSEEWKMLVFAVMSSPAKRRNSTLGNAIASPTRYGMAAMHLYAPTPAGAQFVSIPNLTLISYLRAAS